MKRLAITDFTDSSPKNHWDSYYFDSMKSAFAHCRFVNKIDAHPDVDTVMRAINAEFSSNPKFKSLLINRIFTTHCR